MIQATSYERNLDIGTCMRVSDLWFSVHVQADSREPFSRMRAGAHCDDGVRPSASAFLVRSR